MALKDKTLNTWKNETKLNKHQSVAVFEFLNDDKIDKSIPKQVSEMRFVIGARHKGILVRARSLKKHYNNSFSITVY